MEYTEEGMIGTFEPMCKIRFLSDPHPDEDYIAVPAGEMIELIAAQMRLNALEAGGVDNWSWYGDSLYEALKSMPECYDNHFWDWVRSRKANDETVDDYVEGMNFEDYAQYEVDLM